MASLFTDITANLKSLSFDAGLTEEERDLLFLQKRSHAVRTCMVSQACYLVAIINDGKRLIFEKQQKDADKKDMSWKEIPERKALRIGILGCGSLGKSLAINLQRFSGLHPEEILISTRRPDQLTDFIEAGIACFFDNKKLVKHTDLTFICCLPSQFEEVMKEINGSVRCLLYSFVFGFPRTKICKWLNFYDVIKPELILGSKERTAESNWNAKQNISHALEAASKCELICPGNNNDGIVTTPWKLAVLMVYIFTNVCIVQGLPKQEIVDMVNTIMFGISYKDDSLIVKEEDLWSQDSNDALVTISLNETEYQIFSLDKLQTLRTEIENILEDSENPAGSRFRKRYAQLFDKRKSWRTDCKLVYT